jgi:hypothetical protein
VSQPRLHHAPHIGVGVDGEDHCHIVARGNGGDRIGNRFHAIAKIFAPVRGDGHDALAGQSGQQRIKRDGQAGFIADPLARGEQRIDHGVAGDVNGRLCHIFRAQCLGRGFGGGEVEIGNGTRDLAVHLFGPWLVNVSAAQTRFDMANGNLAEIGGERGRHGGERITMHKDAVRLMASNVLPRPSTRLASSASSDWLGLHHVQINVRRDAGNLQHLIQDFAVLGGDAHECFQRRFLPERMNHGKHLDRLWSRAKDGDDPAP